MNKFKIMTVLALGLALTGCTDDDYVSKRHPEGEIHEVTDEDMEEISTEENPTENQDDQSLDQAEDQMDENNEEEVIDDGINYTVEDTVNVRIAPNETSNIITTVGSGDEIIKLGESDDWTRISIDGQTGYIRSDLLIAR